MAKLNEQFQRMQELAGINKPIKENQNFDNIISVSADYKDLYGFIDNLIEGLESLGIIVKQDPYLKDSDQIGILLSKEDFDEEEYADYIRSGFDEEGEELDENLNESYQDKLQDILADYGSENEIELYIQSLQNDPHQEGYEDFTDEDYVEDFKEYIANKSL